MKEGYKRSAHNDFATSAELKERKFTGIRRNSITDEQELWVVGEVKLAMSLFMLDANPGLWEKKYAEIFGLHHVETKGN